MSFTVHRDGALEYLRADALAGAIHCFSTRFGGVSTGYLKSLNLGVHRGDTPENVEKNYGILGAAVGFRPENLVFTHQIHSDIVRRVGAADRGEGLARPVPLDCDGLITDEPDVALAVFSADCTPILLHDPVRGAVGAVHAGWRGTAAGIAAKAVEAMTREFGSDPEHMLAAIGPSICKNCYTVNGDVAKRFDERFYEEGTGTDQYQLDLQAANRALMIEAGIPAESISMPDLCTGCNPDLLFSHRASKGKRGTMAAFLSLTNKS